MLNINSSESYYNKGIAQFEKGRYDLSIENFKKAIDKNPTNSQYYYNLGLAYIKVEQYDLAIESFNEGIKYNSNDADLFHNLGIAYFNNDQIFKAIKAYEQALELKSDDPDIYGNLGIAYFNLKNYDDAIKCFSKAVELNPENPSFNYNLAYTYYENEQYDLAEQLLLGTVALNNQDYDAYFNLGNIYLKQKNYPKAIENYNAVLSIMPDHAKAKAALDQINSIENAELLAEKQETEIPKQDPPQDKPVNLLKLALAEKPKEELVIDMEIEAENSFTVGINYLENHELELAIENLKNAIILRNNYQEAQEAFEKASNLLKEANNLFDIGLSFFTKNKFNYACDYFKQALAIKPNDNQFKDMLDRTQKKIEFIEKAKKDCCLYIEKGRYYLAIEVAEKLVAEAPLDPDAYFQLGIICIKQKNYEQAIKCLKKVLSLDPKRKDASDTLYKLILKINK